jgi:hypothetical protein
MKIRKALLSYMSTIICFPLLSQTSCAAQNLVSEIAFGGADSSIAGDLSAGAVLGGGPGTNTGSPVSADPKTEQPWQPDPNKLHIAIYPVYGWAPIFGGHVNIPNTPSTPGGGGGSTNSSLNGAAMAGFSIQKKKWYGDLNFMYAGMNASRTNPLINLNLDGRFAGGQVGYAFYRDFYFTGGFRYLGLSYSITVGSFPPFHRSPGVTDPLLGLLWRRQVSRKWLLRVNVQGGGFGVGSNVDVSATGLADWQFVKHFGITMGYGVIHFDISDTKSHQTLTVNQTLNGPQFGFGIYF